MQQRHNFFHKSAQKYNKEKKNLLKSAPKCNKDKNNLPKNALKYKYIYIQKSHSTYLTNYRVFV